MTATERLIISEYASAAGQGQFAYGQPAPALRPYVRRYGGFYETAMPPFQRLEVPSADVALIINFGAAFVVAGPGPTVPPTPHDSFVVGLHTTSALVTAVGPSACVQVDFTPLGAHRCLGVAMRALANRTVALADVLGPAGTRLVEQLAAADSWAARFALLDQVLLARSMAAPALDERLPWIWEQLTQAGGQVAIAALAAETGWSQRHLIARCREAFGLPPKLLARVLRFDRLMQLLATLPPPIDWRQLASACGYYDQAHLINEVQQFSGQTPVALVQRQLPDAGGWRGD